jgi:hypothetical protein
MAKKPAIIDQPAPQAQGENMTDTTTATASTSPSRKAVADRQWIDGTGNEVTDETQATGFRYVDLATKRAFVYQTKLPAGQANTMLAIFGGLTKAGNVRNTLINGPQGDPNADPIEAIDDWFTLLESGTWAEERVGGVGARFNKDVLAQAVAEVAGHTVGSEFHTQRLARLTANEKVEVTEPNGKKNTILYGTYVLRNKAVKDKYDSLMPTRTTAPDLAAL